MQRSVTLIFASPILRSPESTLGVMVPVVTGQKLKLIHGWLN